MAEREEELLKGYFLDLKVKEEDTPDALIETSIIRGIERGKQRRKRIRITYGFAAVMAVILLFFVTVASLEAWDHRVEIAKQMPKDWKELEVFRPLAENNITLKTALDAGYVQHFEDAVAESNGYKLTINGAVVDRKGLLLLYTFENNTGKKVKLDGLRLKSRSGSDLNYGLYSSFFSGESDNTKIKRDLLDVRWADVKDLEDQLTAELIITENTPEAMLSSSTKYRTSLKVPIKLDKLALQTAGEEFNLNKRIVIADQSVIIKNVSIAPTGIYVNIQSDPANTMNIFSLIAPKLIQGDGEQTVELGNSLAYGDMNNGLTLVFGHNNMVSDGSIDLTLKGIHALEKSKLELIVDLDSLEILRSPDNNLKVTREAAGASAGQFILNYTVKNSGKSYEETMSSISINNKFTDGEGIQHELSPGNSMTQSSSPDGYSSSNNYDVGVTKLPQPLTFHLERYPNPILESHFMKIR
ncbi:DUF4179 domain-containing protein [Paenibacillus sp. BR2-3]|uniref:DUF4179 domain-containing protein n=1 Tax=Paenibacillus sp. BR2-3 TaxID=3048494 RepID=UPI003977894A